MPQFQVSSGHFLTVKRPGLSVVNTPNHSILFLSDSSSSLLDGNQSCNSKAEGNIGEFLLQRAQDTLQLGNAQRTLRIVVILLPRTSTCMFKLVSWAPIQHCQQFCMTKTADRFPLNNISYVILFLFNYMCSLQCCTQCFWMQKVRSVNTEIGKGINYQQ